MLDYNSEAYARYEDSHPGFWNRIRGDKVLEFLRPEAGDRILEIGCNTGWLVREIMGYSDNVVGVDINFAGLRIANMENLLCMDAANLGFSDNSFDKVVCLHTIEHVQEVGKALEEMCRVLKPSGSIVLIYPFELIRGSCAVGGALAMYSSILKARQLHVHKLRPRKIGRLIAGNGLLQKESVIFMDPWPAFLTILQKKISSEN
jgi:ubiquinone/menaquinone biosynthesis C-methylase UbiE